jgi:hypothetical protein
MNIALHKFNKDPQNNRNSKYLKKLLINKDKIKQIMYYNNKIIMFKIFKDQLFRIIYIKWGHLKIKILLLIEFLVIIMI